jgi:type I restriction enzyme S subunit
MREPWARVALKDTGTWLSGGTPFTDEPRYWSGDIPWISAASMKDFRISKSDRCVTEAGARSGTRLVPPGTVIFVVRGMSLKTEFRVGVTEREVAFGQDCKAILPAPGIDAKFLALALKARERRILAMVDEAGHGTGRLPTDLISKFEIDIPDLAEQQRIVEVIDSINRVIDGKRDVLRKRRELLASLAEYFMSKAAAHPWIRLANIVQSAVDGPFGSNLKSGHYVEVPGIRVVRLQNIGVAEFIDDDRAYISTHHAASLARHDAHSGDLLVASLGDERHPMARACIYPAELAAGIVKADCFRLRLDAHIALNDYVMRALNSLMLKPAIRAATQGVTRDRINLSSLLSIKIPVPLLRFQGEMVVALDAELAVIRSIEKEFSKLQALKQGSMDDLLTGRVRAAVLAGDLPPTRR